MWALGLRGLSDAGAVSCPGTRRQDPAKVLILRSVRVISTPIEAASSDSLFAGIRRVVGLEAAIVSTDHFRQELCAQLGRAAMLGHIDVLVNSGELCRATPNGAAWSNSCTEFKLGDTLVLDRSNGAGMTVR
jgi:hypothetical protein